MIEKLSNWLERNANGWLILILLAVEIAFMGFILPGAQAKIEGFSGGVGVLDLTFFPSAEKILADINAYGDEGRAFYRTVELTADILYPISYTLFYSLLAAFLLQRAFPANGAIQRLNVIPFGAWFFDLLENVGLVGLLSVFPAQPVALAWFVTFANGVKWIFAGASVLVLFFALGAWVFRKIRGG